MDLNNTIDQSSGSALGRSWADKLPWLEREGDLGRGPVARRDRQGPEVPEAPEMVEIAKIAEAAQMPQVAEAAHKAEMTERACNATAQHGRESNGGKTKRIENGAHP